MLQRKNSGEPGVTNVDARARRTEERAETTQRWDATDATRDAARVSSASAVHARNAFTGETRRRKTAWVC